MNKILVKGREVYLDRINTGALGKDFRLSGVKIDVSKSPKWINREQFHCTWYIFRYIGTDEFFSFYFDENNKFIHKLNHTETIKIM